MKFDKTTIIVFVLCGALLLSWDYITQKLGWKAPAQETAPQTEKVADTPAEPAKQAPAVKTVKDQVAKKTEETVDIAGTIKTSEYPAVDILDDNLEAEMQPIQGASEAIILKKFLKSDRKSNIVMDGGIKPGAFAVDSKAEWKVLAIEKSEKVSPNTYLLVRKIAVNGHLIQLRQQWTLKENYQIAYEVAIKNMTGTALTMQDFSVVSSGLEPLLYFSGDTVRRETHGIDYFTVDGNFYDVNADKKLNDFHADNNSPIAWAGVSNKYFACVLKPEKPFDTIRANVLERSDKDDNNYFSVNVAGVYKKLDIEAGETTKMSFTYFCGPKEISLLKSFDDSATKLMHLSWGPLDWIALVMLRFLVWLKGICGSYGWSIIILTVIVRLLFWPVTQKANKSMKKMQKIQPMVQALKEQYKDNPQVLNSKIMALYKEQHVNPLGGCLPILLQIPVFFALYATLDGAVELRQVSFWWAQDLSMPDTVGHIFGLAINPMILAMTILMVVQQKLTPMSGDPMQKKMMMLMPVIMLIFLYSLPSGLTLYWTVSQIFSIIQLLITQKVLDKNDTAAAKAA